MPCSGARLQPRGCSPRGHRPVVGCPLQAALLDGAVLPPPASRALVLAGPGRARAWSAPDGRVAKVIQRVVGHVVLLDVGPHLILRPNGERRDLGEPCVLVVVGDDLGLRSSRRLLAPYACDPCVVAAQRAGERARFADLTAEPAQLD